MFRWLSGFVVGLVSLLMVASPADAMIGGAADGNAHPYVVGVADPNEGGVVFTGTVISPTVVFTVGGCISSGTATQMRVDTAAAPSCIGRYVTLP